MPSWPIQEHTDPKLLRAMAHPLRLKLLNALLIHGPATATELADRLGDSAANCSWHLRQLAKFGFIEEAADLPTKGRNRLWRWIPAAHSWSAADESPEVRLAGDELTAQLMQQEFAERRGWEQRKAYEPRVWQEAAFAMVLIAWLTPEELDSIAHGIHELFEPYHERLTDQAQRPPQARPVRFVAWGNPAT